MKFVKFSTDTTVYAGLDDAEFRSLIIGALRYAKTGEEPSLDTDRCRMAWLYLRRDIDEQSETYQRLCLRNQANATSRYQSHQSHPLVDSETEKERTKEKEKDYSKETLLSNDNNSKKRRVFVPPKVEEVQAYCSERNNGIDAQLFVDFYTARDWMIGKNKMKDWKAAVRTWERSRTQPSRKNPALRYEQTPINEGAFNSLVVNLENY